MNFDLDKKIYEAALANPFKGSSFPERAALGRAAEPELIRIYASIRGGSVIRSGKSLPKEIVSEYGHDGCLFLDAQLSAVLEAKLALKPTVTISKRELQTLDWCLENNVPYVLIIGKHVGDLVGKYLGAVEITRDVKHSLGTETMYGLQFTVSKLNLT